MIVNIGLEQKQLAKLIDDHVNKYPDNDTGNEHLLTTIYDYMEPFKTIMDTTTREQMDYLSSQYPGFYRFGKLLESIAQGVADGIVEVPKDH